MVEVVNMFFKKKSKEKYGETLLKCPRCNKNMEKLKKENVIIDVCNKCKGMWLDKDEIESRKKIYVYFINNGNYEFHTDKEAKQIEKKYIKTELSETKEINGRCANVGFYRGRVKAISFSSDKKFSDEVKKMEYGDVLVTDMTRPQLIEACEKAKAIVTDEGGICSHAAVVSRELNIPCVVGTKISTKVLKDGDLVEVDATNGVVRICDPLHRPKGRGLPR